MQNEITELRNQVRTLKMVVCLVCCLFGVFVFIGCSGRGANMNRGGTYTSDNSDGSDLIPPLLITVLGISVKEDEEIHQTTPNNWPTQGRGGTEPDGTPTNPDGTPSGPVAPPAGGGTTPPGGYQTNPDAPTSNPEHHR